MLGPVILDKEEENQIDHTKDKTKLISNIRKHPMRPNQTRMYDASFSLFKEEEITFQHRWAFKSDISCNIQIIFVSKHSKYVLHFSNIPSATYIFSYF